MDALVHTEVIVDYSASEWRYQIKTSQTKDNGGLGARMDNWHGV